MDDVRAFRAGGEVVEFGPPSFGVSCAVCGVAMSGEGWDAYEDLLTRTAPDPDDPWESHHFCHPCWATRTGAN